MKKTLLGILTIIIAVPTLASAKTAEAESVCDLSEKYKAYVEISAKNDYSDNGIKAELSIRKDLLAASIDCAQLDVVSLKDSLSKSPENVSGNLRKNLLSSLEESLKYYEQKKNTLDGLGIQGVKDVAREIHAWRENNFATLAKRIKNYLVWQENQDIFAKTEERLKQIENLISSLKMLEDSDLQDISRRAVNNLLNARNENSKTKASLESNLNSEEVLSSMKKSLEYLSSVYGNFIEISDHISEIIPRNKK